MRTINDYLDTAKARTGATSDRKLAQLLGIGATTLFHLQRRRNYPSDELMTKLAMLAGIDPQVALLDLCIWRAGENSLARSTYIQIARRLGKSAAALFLAGCLGATAALMSPSPARAAANFAEGTDRAQVRICDMSSVYYGKLMLDRLQRIPAGWRSGCRLRTKQPPPIATTAPCSTILWPSRRSQHWQPVRND
jgi:hypothetical protein